jgi:hypothetical protein
MMSLSCLYQKNRQLLLSTSLPPSTRELHRHNPEGSVQVLINNQPEENHVFFQKHPSAAVVFALHGLHNHGKPIRSESNVTGAVNKSTLQLDFDTRQPRVEGREW